MLTTLRANTQFDSELVWAAANPDAPPRLTGQLQVDPLHTRSQGQFQLSQMQWPSELALQQLGLDFKLAQQDEGLDGDWTFRVAQADWQASPLPDFSATDWQQQGQLQQRDRLLAVAWQLSGKHWQLSDLQGSLQVQLHSTQLDLGILQKLLALLQVPARQREYQLPLLFLQDGTRFLQQAPQLKLDKFTVFSNVGNFSLRVHAQAIPSDETAPWQNGCGGDYWQSTSMPAHKRPARQKPTRWPPHNWHRSGPRCNSRAIYGGLRITGRPVLPGRRDIG